MADARPTVAELVYEGWLRLRFSVTEQLGEHCREPTSKGVKSSAARCRLGLAFLSPLDGWMVVLGGGAANSVSVQPSSPSKAVREPLLHREAHAPRRLFSSGSVEQERQGKGVGSWGGTR